MRWLHNKSFSSSPSSSSSPVSFHSSRNKTDNINNPFGFKNSRNNSSGNSNHNNNDNNNNDKKDSRGPRLTRQKKLRHWRDQEFVGVAKIAHADLAESGSPRDNDHTSATLRTSTSMPSPVPLPLPLPLPLPVTVDYGGRGVEERERDGFRDRVDGTAEGVSSNSPIARLFFSSLLF